MGIRIVLTQPGEQIAEAELSTVPASDWAPLKMFFPRLEDLDELIVPYGYIADDGKQDGGSQRSPSYGLLQLGWRLDGHAEECRLIPKVPSS